MKNRWNKQDAKGKDRLNLLVYRSRLIGQEPSLCVWGGGNTSTKGETSDFQGRRRKVIWVKGSGSDLKASERQDFPMLFMDEVLHALNRENMSDEEMVDFLMRCLANPMSPRPSIEALLHAFVPELDIDHTHADAVLSLTNTVRGEGLCRKVFGKELLWIPYLKPGFTLAKRMAQAYQKNPKTKGALLEKHGLITWGKSAYESYSHTIEMVTRAECFIVSQRRKRRWSLPATESLPRKEREVFLEKNLPTVRRALSRTKKVLLTYSDTPSVLEFVNARMAKSLSQIGPATPDHMLRTKRVPLFVNPKHPLLPQIEAYAKAHRRYYLHYRKSGQPMLDPYPRVILIPGVGMIASGKDLKEVRVVAEIYEHSIAIQRNASTVDRYRSLSLSKAFEMEYWPLELYKLSLAAPEAELARQVGIVTGAAGGIGQAIADVLGKAGAHLLLTDIDGKKVARLAEELNEKLRFPRMIGLRMDVTDEKSVKEAFRRALLVFGGVDFIVSNAGVAHVSPVESLRLEDWNESLAVNATGHFLVAREAVRLLKAQGFGGSIVFIASKNVLAPGKDFGAYSAAKSAEVQLARILAIEHGESKIRVNLINPDGVFEGSGLWAKIKETRAKSHGVPPKALEAYYQNRNLMKVRVLPEDVAQAVLFFVSKRSAKTTGCILTVDGGVKEAFPR